MPIHYPIEVQVTANGDAIGIATVQVPLKAGHLRRHDGQHQISVEAIPVEDIRNAIDEGHILIETED